jgi:hypothetical protein
MEKFYFRQSGTCSLARVRVETRRLVPGSEDPHEVAWRCRPAGQDFPSHELEIELALTVMMFCTRQHAEKWVLLAHSSSYDLI